MKTIFKISGAIAIAALMACNSNTKTEASNDSTATSADSAMAAETSSAAVVPGTYVDLSTGKEVQVVADPQTGYAINSETRAPLEFYVNTASGDTLYRTGIIVNDVIVKEGSTWEFDEDMIERDGDNIKIKTDASGDTKVKNKTTDTKVKTDADGDAKIKSPDSKTKIDDGEVTTKDRD